MSIITDTPIAGRIGSWGIWTCMKCRQNFLKHKNDLWLLKCKHDKSDWFKTIPEAIDDWNNMHGVKQTHGKKFDAPKFVRGRIALIKPLTEKEKYERGVL